MCVRQLWYLPASSSTFSIPLLTDRKWRTSGTKRKWWQLIASSCLLPSKLETTQKQNELLLFECAAFIYRCRSWPWGLTLSDVQCESQPNFHGDNRSKIPVIQIETALFWRRTSQTTANYGTKVQILSLLSFLCHFSAFGQFHFKIKANKNLLQVIAFQGIVQVLLWIQQCSHG